MGFRKKVALFFSDITELWILPQAAALAFYLTMALAPLLLLFFLVFSSSYIDMQVKFIRAVNYLLGEKTAKLFDSIFEYFVFSSPAANSITGLIALLILLVTASGVFAQLRDSLDLVITKDPNYYSKIVKSKTKKKPSFIKYYVLDRLLAIAMALIFVILTTISLVVSSLINTYIQVSSKSPFYNTTNICFSLITFIFVFFLIYRYVPRAKLKSSACLFAAVITSFLFVFGKEIIGHLASRTLLVSAYGTNAFLIVLMVWFYYAAIIIFTGAEIASLYQKK